MGNDVKTDYNLYVFRSVVEETADLGFYSYIIRNNETKEFYEGYGNMANPVKPTQVDLYGIIAGLYVIPDNKSVYLRTDSKTAAAIINGSRHIGSVSNYKHYESVLTDAIRNKYIETKFIPDDIDTIYTDKCKELIDIAIEEFCQSFIPKYNDKNREGGPMTRNDVFRIYKNWYHN